ncbi:hypothetical protein SISSUDRAFT_1037065 [Sistotremastrum suecicum HHB10207 ss-3]|uniref:Uncharacterized protein n=1 Tax=Sistotremastrum suecicum HHB10207 ss-3 TaxID=1314776 RepID=A0A165YMQ1_9AGAM|nr:hypothetical protein SISSUDRAFT_1037065 [Sistotremastrum suecicum HHB10207 ss-3]
MAVNLYDMSINTRRRHSSSSPEWNVADSSNCGVSRTVIVQGYKLLTWITQNWEGFRVRSPREFGTRGTSMHLEKRWKIIEEIQAEIKSALSNLVLCDGPASNWHAACCTTESYTTAVDTPSGLLCSMSTRYVLSHLPSPLLQRISHVDIIENACLEHPILILRWQLTKHHRVSLGCTNAQVMESRFRLSGASSLHPLPLRQLNRKQNRENIESSEYSTTSEVWMFRQ